MNIAIIDDSKDDALRLSAMCKAFAQKSGATLSVTAYPNAESFLAKYKPGMYHLVFMDIYMNKKNGIDAAQELRKADIYCMVVFLTTSREHVWESFSIHPFDYLIKPCEQEQIDRVLTEALRTLPDFTKALELTCGRQKMRFPYGELISLESDGHHAQVSSVSRDTKRCYITSFSDLWNTLSEDKRFLLCNRGIILNMEHIEKLSDSVFIMKSGQVFPIRQNNRKEVVQAFLSYEYEQARMYGRRYMH